MLSGETVQVVRCYRWTEHDRVSSFLAEENHIDEFACCGRWIRWVVAKDTAVGEDGEDRNEDHPCGGERKIAGVVLL